MAEPRPTASAAPLSLSRGLAGPIFRTCPTATSICCAATDGCLPRLTSRCSRRWTRSTSACQRHCPRPKKAKQSGFEARFIELAGQVNGSMPHAVVQKIADALNTRRKSVNGARILIAGVAYKRDVGDMRESPSLDVMHVLQQRGADVSYTDPYVPKLDAAHWPGGTALESVNSLDARVLRSFDCTAILTDHTVFDYEAIVEYSDVVVDTRNAVKRPAANVFRLGAPAFQESLALEVV